MSQAEVLRPKDAARFLGVSIQTLYRWTWTGKICRPFKIGVIQYFLVMLNY